MFLLLCLLLFQHSGGKLHIFQMPVMNILILSMFLAFLCFQLETEDGVHACQLCMST